MQYRWADRARGWERVVRHLAFDCILIEIENEKHLLISSYPPTNVISMAPMKSMVKVAFVSNGLFSNVNGRNWCKRFVWNVTARNKIDSVKLAAALSELSELTMNVWTLAISDYRAYSSAQNSNHLNINSKVFLQIHFSKCNRSFLWLLWLPLRFQLNVIHHILLKEESEYSNDEAEDLAIGDINNSFFSPNMRRESNSDGSLQQQPMTPMNLYELMWVFCTQNSNSIWKIYSIFGRAYATALLTIIEDFSPMDYDTSVHDNLVEKMEMVLHEADTTHLLTDEKQVRDLVHIILRLQTAFKRHFPSDFDVYEWQKFFSKHVVMLDAISWMLMSNVQNLVDFMNSNYAIFTDQSEIMTELTKLYEDVFNTYFDER